MITALLLSFKRSLLHTKQLQQLIWSALNFRRNAKTHDVRARESSCFSYCQALVRVEFTKHSRSNWNLTTGAMFYHVTTLFKGLARLPHFLLLQNKQTRTRKASWPSSCCYRRAQQSQNRSRFKFVRRNDPALQATAAFEASSSQILQNQKQSRNDHTQNKGQKQNEWGQSMKQD